MEVTKERLDELMQGLKRVAMENRERAGFKGQFTPVAIVVGPTGEHAVQPTIYRNAHQKAIVMKALSLAARNMGVIAIVLVSDTFHVKVKSFSERFNIPEGLSWDEWQKIYREILDVQFEGSIANLPENLRSDALVLAMKGPMVQQRVFFMPYHEGVGDSIRWDAEEPEHEAEILMLEDWWDKTPVN